MRKVLIVIFVLAGIFTGVFAGEMSKEELEKKMKCYLEMDKYLYSNDDKLREYQIILPLMKMDGFTCEQIVEFIKKNPYFK